MINKNKQSGKNRKIFGITENIKAKVLSILHEKPEEKIRDFLRLNTESNCLVFRRLRYIDNEPLSYTINYMSLSIGSLIEKSHLEKMTMLEALENIAEIILRTIHHDV